MDARNMFLKYTFVVNLILVALIAFFTASAVNGYIAGQLVGASSKATASVSTTAPAVNKFSPPVTAIVSRDLFGSITKIDPIGMDDGNTADGEIQETQLRLKLLGIAFSYPDSPLNIATIRNLKDQTTGVFLVGSPIAEDATVHMIEYDRVVLRRANGNLEELRLEETEDGKKRPGPPVLSARGSEGNEGDQQFDIQQTGPNQYVISREDFESAMSADNIGNLLTQARTIPNKISDEEGEKIDGFRIYRIRPGSVFQQLGLRNGDVIKSVNGKPLDNIQAAVGLWQSLRGESSFSLDVERRSVPMQMQYEIK